MTPPRAGPAVARSHAKWTVLIGVAAAAGILLGLASSWTDVSAVGDDIARAAWLLPGLVALHLSQLFLAGLGWRSLFTGAAPAVAEFYRLRIIREGIDSLLPVAQIGGEIVGTRLLARSGPSQARSAASIVVDVTVELFTQVAFLLTGLCLLAARPGGAAWQGWIAALLAGAAAVAAVVALQRLGALRLLEGLLRGMARRWPALESASLEGIHAEALGFYRSRPALGRSTVLHYLGWAGGSIETWAVLHAIGVPVSPSAAFIIESLGMAARSAGFAIPAALVAQESGFLLAGAAVGVAAAPALALSLVKRLREILVGGIGLVLWRTYTRPAAAS